MLITPSNKALRNWPREGNNDFASLFKHWNEASKIHKRHRWEASEVHEIKDDNMSITCSISVAQTDDRVLKANCYFDCCLYWSIVKLAKGIGARTKRAWYTKDKPVICLLLFLYGLYGQQINKLFQPKLRVKRTGWKYSKCPSWHAIPNITLFGIKFNTFLKYSNRTTLLFFKTSLYNYSSKNIANNFPS